MQHVQTHTVHGIASGPVQMRRHDAVGGCKMGRVHIWVYMYVPDTLDRAFLAADMSALRMLHKVKETQQDPTFAHALDKMTPAIPVMGSTLAINARTLT